MAFQASAKFLKITWDDLDDDRRVKDEVFGKIPAGDFNFALMTDPQLGMFDSVVEGGDGQEYQEEYDNLHLTLKNLENISPKLDFAVILGDMVNQMPEGSIKENNPQMENHGAVHFQQAEDFNTLVSDSDFTVPLFVIPGNHDLGNNFNMTSYDIYYDEFGADYFYFKTEDTAIIFICSQYMRDEFNLLPQLAQEEWTWIEARFAEWAADDSVKKVIINMHNPLYLETPDEEHTGVCWDVEQRDRFLDLLDLNFVQNSQKNVYQFTGHTHQGADTSEFVQNNNAVTCTKVRNPETGRLELVKGTYGGVRLVHAETETLTHSWYLTDEIPETWPEQGSSAGKFVYSVVSLVILLIW